MKFGLQHAEEVIVLGSDHEEAAVRNGFAIDPNKRPVLRDASRGDEAVSCG